MNSRHGLSLVELLVAMTLVSIVLIVTARFFVQQNQISNFQKGIDEASESTRLALSLLTWDLQNAGFRVSTSTANPAIIATSNGLSDSLIIRFRDDSFATPLAQRLIYDLGGNPASLRRAQYADDPNVTPSLNESVASIVALNIRYETRANQFVSPVSNVCPLGTAPVPVGATGASILNCRVLWEFKDVPERLVRKVKVQVLARSENKIPNFSRAGETVTFDGGLTYALQAGYAYHFAEQVVITENLGR